MSSTNGKVLVACNACRKRKVKCDGRDPCSSCRLADLKCKYDAVQGPFVEGSFKTGLISAETALYIKTLEQRVRTLEQASKQRSDTPSAIPQSNDGTAPVSGLGALSAITDGSHIYVAEAQRQSLYDVLLRHMTKLLGDTNQYRTFFKSALRAFATIDQEEVALTVVPTTPSSPHSLTMDDMCSEFCRHPAQVQNATTCYFQICNTRFPVLQIRRWQEQFRLHHLLCPISMHLSPEEIELRIMSLMVISFGAHLMYNELPGQLNTVGWTMFCRARSWWQLLNVKGSRLATVQSGLLLFLYLERANLGRTATLLASTVGRLLGYTGMHRIVQCPDISHEDNMLRRNLFWCFNVADNAMLWTNGVPIIFPPLMYDQVLPTVAIDQDTTHISFVHLTEAPFIAMCQLTELSAQVYCQIYAPKATNMNRDHELFLAIDEYSRQLSGLADRLPISARPRSFSELLEGPRAHLETAWLERHSQWVPFHMMYYHLLLQLNRAILIDPGQSQTTDQLRLTKPLTQWELDGRSVALACCRWLLHISPLVSTGNCLNQTSTGCDFHMINTALVVIATEAVARPQYSDGQDLKLAKDVLRRLKSIPAIQNSQAHHSAVNFIDRIADMAELATISPVKTKDNSSTGNSSIST